MLVTPRNRVVVQGHASAGLEAVRGVGRERRSPPGWLCVYHHGEKVVDLWGGIRDKWTGSPGSRTPMVLVYSATKGVAAMTLAIAHALGAGVMTKNGCADSPDRFARIRPVLEASPRGVRHVGGSRVLAIQYR
jgi:hypothetical protein